MKQYRYFTSCIFNLNIAVHWCLIIILYLNLDHSVKLCFFPLESPSDSTQDLYVLIDFLCVRGATLRFDFFIIMNTRACAEAQNFFVTQETEKENASEGKEQSDV